MTQEVKRLRHKATGKIYEVKEGMAQAVCIDGEYKVTVRTNVDRKKELGLAVADICSTYYITEPLTDFEEIVE